MRIRARGGRDSVCSTGKETKADGRSTVKPRPAEVSGRESLGLDGLSCDSRTLEQLDGPTERRLVRDPVHGIFEWLKVRQAGSGDGEVVL